MTETERFLQEFGLSLNGQSAPGSPCMCRKCGGSIPIRIIINPAVIRAGARIVSRHAEARSVSTIHRHLAFATLDRRRAGVVAPGYAVFRLAVGEALSLIQIYAAGSKDGENCTHREIRNVLGHLLN